MKKLILSVAFIATSIATFAQIGIGTNTPQASLDVTGDQGMLLPRMADHTTLAPVDGTLDATEAGLEVYNTTTKKVMIWDGTAWTQSSNVTDTDGYFYYRAPDDKVEIKSTASDLLDLAAPNGAIIDIKEYAGTLDAPTATGLGLLGSIRFSGHDGTDYASGVEMTVLQTAPAITLGPNTRVPSEFRFRGTTLTGEFYDAFGTQSARRGFTVSYGLDLQAFGQGNEAPVTTTGSGSASSEFYNIIVEDDGRVVEIYDTNVYRIAFLGIGNTWKNSGDYTRLLNEISDAGDTDANWVYGYMNNDVTALYRFKFRTAETPQIKATNIEVFDAATRTFSSVVTGDPIADASGYFHRVNAPRGFEAASSVVSSTGPVTGATVGMIRFNTGTTKFQGFTGIGTTGADADGWVDLN